MESDIDEGLMQGAEHLKTIFDLCDRDKDGCISAQEFRIIGLEYFGDTQVPHSPSPTNCNCYTQAVGEVQAL